MKRFATLQRTLTLHFLLVAMLPALTFGFVAIGLLHKHLQESIHQRNQLLSEEVAATAGEFLAEVETDLGMIARIIQAGTILQRGAVDEFLEAAVDRSERFESIYLLDRSLHVKALGLAPRLRSQQGDYLGTDYSRHALFQQQEPLDRPTWSDTFVSLDTGVPSVTLAIPVGDGMLLGNISLQTLSELMARFTRGTGDSYAIVDHAGTLVAASDPAMAMQRLNLSFHATIARALQGQNDTTVERHQEQTLLESTAGIARTGWVAWVGVDLDQGMATINDIRDLLAGFLLLALIFAGCTAVLDARRLLLPLAELSERAGQIGAGQYDFAAVPTGLGEIDQLAASLQKMSLAVRDREHSLVESEQRFRNLVNSIDGVVWEMETDSGRYLFVSEQSATLFGFSPVKWLDDPGFWISRVHPADRDKVVLREGLVLAGTSRHDQEYRFLAANDREIWIRDLMTVIREDGQPRRLLGVMIDATQRRRATEELERYRSDLEELVAQRTRELRAAQDELVQKERLAVLGQLTATVSHEIRNPLGTVANALYLLRETLGDDCLGRVERPLALAERSVERCDGIISELLDFTRRRELQRVAVSLDDWLTAVLDEMLWPAAVQRHWQLASGAVVPIDPERLRRAMVNVIDNALQAMAAKEYGEQLLEILTRRRGGRCEIVVRDTGVGIPDELMERIYEPMFSTKSFGVGLGVPIIRNIMEDHGGGVDYSSKAGEGTEVTLWLPLPA